MLLNSNHIGMKKILLLLLVPLFIVSCSDDDWRDDVRIMTVTVASQTRAYTPVFGTPRQGVVVKFKDDGEWERLGSIRDFDYEIGYEYTIKVKRQRYDPNIADTPYYYYSLVKELSKVKKNSADLPRDIWGGACDHRLGNDANDVAQR